MQITESESDLEIRIRNKVAKIENRKLSQNMRYNTTIFKNKNLMFLIRKWIIKI